jgi:thioester reductase-like protein
LEKLYHSTRLVVLDGDILLPNLGLTEPGLDAIRKNVNIIIHAASSINMIKPLGRLARTIIDPTEMIADFALSCTQMDRFVYVSTAYANAHLYQRSQNTDVKIDEEIYELTHHYHAFDELNELRKHGKSQAYEAENFPWAYAYAKHLTERMLQSRFT